MGFLGVEGLEGVESMGRRFWCGLCRQSCWGEGATYLRPHRLVFEGL